MWVKEYTWAKRESVKAQKKKWKEVFKALGKFKIILELGPQNKYKIYFFEMVVTLK